MLLLVYRRALQSRLGPPRSEVADSSAPPGHANLRHRQDLAELPTDRIAQYLVSLDQPEATHTRRLRTAAEREGDVSELGDASSHPGVEHQDTPLLPSRRDNCEVESVWSECSVRSGSSFDTRDEAAFRDGLSALDASIASLQKTIQLDLGR